MFLRLVRAIAWRRLEPGLRVTEAALASVLWRFPARQLKVIGVTGTDGKTSTCHLIQAILDAAGIRSGIVTTISEAVVTDREPVGHELTTPNPWRLHRLLRAMVDDGAQWAIVETTSHGLALQRVAFVPFHVAVLTDISREHVDFHHSMDRYIEAKTALFRRRLHLSVLSRETLHADRFEACARGRTVYYGLDGGDVTAEDICPGRGTQFTLSTESGKRPVSLPWSGLMNVRNALAAAAVGVGIGLDLDAIVSGLEHAPALPGRLEWVQDGVVGCSFVIDHAHTVAALSHLYATVRPLARGRVIGILGIDGGRDPDKRPGLGLVAGKMCDFVVVTTTHGRREAPETISSQLRVGLERAGRRHGIDFEIVLDRSDAILRAARIARPGDVVVLNGIGHEPYLASNGQKVRWSERVAVEAALTQLRPREDRKREGDPRDDPTDRGSDGDQR